MRHKKPLKPGQAADKIRELLDLRDIDIIAAEQKARDKVKDRYAERIEALLALCGPDRKTAEAMLAATEPKKGE